MTFLLIPPYLIFAFFVMRAVLKKQNTRKRKWQMGLLTAFLLYLPFGWDVILGRAVFYTLCATQGGVHVYQTVELGPEYFDEDGVPLFYDAKMNINDVNVAGKYIIKMKRDRYLSRILNLSKNQYEVIEVGSGKVNGDYILYKYFGGWFMSYTGFGEKGEGCPSSKLASEYLEEMIKNVFVMSKDN